MECGSVQNKFLCGIEEKRCLTAVDKSYLCPVCYKIIWSPVTCKNCMTLVCTPCMKTWTCSHDYCPKCKKGLDFINPNPIILNFLKQMNFKCQNAQCRKQISYSNLENHLCEYDQITCPNPKCNLKYYRKDEKDHQRKCKGASKEESKSPSSLCSYCSTRIPASEAYSHVCLQKLDADLRRVDEQNETFRKQIDAFYQKNAILEDELQKEKNLRIKLQREKNELNEYCQTKIPALELTLNQKLISGNRGSNKEDSEKFLQEANKNQALLQGIRDTFNQKIQLVKEEVKKLENKINHPSAGLGGGNQTQGKYPPAPSVGNQIMIQKLVLDNKINSKRVRMVMESIDRAEFVENNPYEDDALSLGFNAKISPATVHAQILEALSLGLMPGGKALDIGSGSGIFTLMMSKMMGPGSRTFGVEHIPDLVLKSRNNVAKSHQDFINNGAITFVTGDGREGLSQYGPFNCINVGGTLGAFPQGLFDQLIPGGIMVVPIGDNNNQKLFLFGKNKYGGVQKQILGNCRFSPLTSKQQQLSVSINLPEMFLLMKMAEMF